MDLQNLKSASNYVNNQLASRGLVRGLPIDFARPAKDPDNPARIINLVHEFVQRRDKEAEQRENLAITIETLRRTETKQASQIETLKTKISNLERKNSMLEAQTRSFNSTIRTAKSWAKSLRDETVRLKTLLAQVRTQHANDIRKRDMQIQKMKERLLDTRRGTRPTASTIVITGAQHVSRSSVRECEAANGTSSSNPLADDTIDFLTTLSQTLADENDNILALLRQCISSLKAVQGLPDDGHNPQTEEEAEDALNPVVAPPANFESISLELDTVMGSLQNMLNQPNYVPVEELTEKEVEIAQLKQRNEILHEEWKKAIDLVDCWNKGLMESVDKHPEPRPRARTDLPMSNTSGGAADAVEQVLGNRDAATGRGGASSRRSQVPELERVEEDEDEDEREPEPEPVAPRSGRKTRRRQSEPESEAEQDPDEDFKPDIRSTSRPRESLEPKVQGEQEESDPQPLQEPVEEQSVVYKEEVTVVRTKSPAPTPRQPRSRRQPGVKMWELGVSRQRPQSRRQEQEPELQPQESTAPKKRRRSSRAKPNPAAEIITTDSPPVKKVKRRSSRRKVCVDAAFDA